MRFTVCLGLLLCHVDVSALEFEPGIGAALEYTDNATLSADNPVEDLIAIGYIGAMLKETEGPVRADITASLNHQRYTQDTFDDQRYFNLGATVDWEMIEQRFDWMLQNFYAQRTIDSLDPNTPDNLQDTNIFSFGANINLPVSRRNQITIRPEYRNFYYEILDTDNQQFSLVTSWSYQMTRLTSVGLNASVRTIDYDAPLVEDVTFTNVSLAISTTRARSDFSTNLGTTRVERDNGQSTEDFAGNLDWLVDLTQRSTFRTYISTNFTDSSTGVLNAIVDPGTGDPINIQATTDVIRNRVLTLAYARVDGTLNSSLTGQLSEIDYSESPNDRRIRSLNAVFNYPVTALLKSGLYGLYRHSEYINVARTDNDYTIGGNLSYQLSRKLKTAFDLKYRNRDSSLEEQGFDEWSAYASLVYGFGSVLRPTRAGGF